jgi:hypothetical protein
MARPTQQEIEEWEARMNEPETPDPDEFDVVLFDANGDPVGTMPFNKAKAYFKRRGIDLDDEQPNATANAGNANPNSAANGGNANGGPQIPSGAPRARATAKYFGKQGGASTAVDPNNLPPGSQPI